ncbi:MAG: hypothetical protein JXB50_15475 [Spirochaetes bacterium]|nr:hypothetical protein [Spirochaetota bacterium]
MSKKKKNDDFDPHKMTRVEIVGKLINGKQVYIITDCDKSFCNVCSKDSCSLEYFFEKNPQKAKIFVNEIYRYEIEKDPSLIDKFVDKKDLITYVLRKCSGYDNCYDFLFRGDKLISIKFDDVINIKKTDQF